MQERSTNITAVYAAGAEDGEGGVHGQGDDEGGCDSVCVECDLYCI